jgi:hypothetical protein
MPGKPRRTITLGPMPQNVHSNTRWQCQYGHQWDAPYANVQQGSGCPACAGCVPKVAHDYYALAKERDFNWVGQLPGSIEEKTTWECRSEHRWEASYHNVDCRESGCPRCRDMVNGALVSSQQRELCRLLGGELNYTVGSWRVDVAFPHLKIAIEYDSFYYHRGREERDATKDHDLLAAGWHILRIRSNKQVPDADALGTALVSLLADASYQECNWPQKLDHMLRW